MALVLPFLLLLVFGIIDFGRAYHAQITLTHAAREAVRIAAFGGGTAAVEAAEASYSPTIDVTGFAVTTCPATATTPASNATVVLSHTFSFATPMPGLAVFYGGSAWSSTVPMQGKAVMRCGG